MLMRETTNPEGNDPVIPLCRDGAPRPDCASRAVVQINRICDPAYDAMIAEYASTSIQMPAVL
jgi:hypothetical protein